MKSKANKMEYFARTHSHIILIKKKQLAQKKTRNTIDRFQTISFFSTQFVYGYHFLLFYVKFLLNFRRLLLIFYF